MNAFELYDENHKPTGIFACGKCRKLTLNPRWHETGQPKSTREEAEKCCRPPVCNTCHKEFKPRYSNQVHECSDCERTRLNIERSARLLKRLETAEDVTGTYDGPIYIEGSNGGDMGEGFYSLADYAVEYFDEEDETDGSFGWAFACKSRAEKLDINDCIENLCSDGYEDMEYHLTIPQSLNDAIDEFNRVNEQALTIYETDYKRKVRLLPHVKGES